MTRGVLARRRVTARRGSSRRSWLLASTRPADGRTWPGWQSATVAHPASPTVRSKSAKTSARRGVPRPGPGEAPQVRAGQHDGARPCRQSLERIRSAPDAAVQEHRHPIGRKIGHLGQCVKSSDGPVDVSPSVVGNHDSLHSLVECRLSVLGLVIPLRITSSQRSGEAADAGSEGSTSG